MEQLQLQLLQAGIRALELDLLHQERLVGFRQLCRALGDALLEGLVEMAQLGLGALLRAEVGA
jgi:hypothetical protein